MKVRHADHYLNPRSASSSTLQRYMTWKWMVVAVVLLVIGVVLVSRLGAKGSAQPSANAPLSAAVAPPPVPPAAPEAVAEAQAVEEPLFSAVEVGQLRQAIGSWNIGGELVSQGSTVYVMGQNANLFRVAVSSSQGEKEWWLSAEQIMEMTQ